uniref:GRIP domain-containing protein n=1 Tax=Rhizochromulina marina TaxID=1034831 RepID=A0A7S2WUX2_9STRA
MEDSGSADSLLAELATWQQEWHKQEEARRAEALEMQRKHQEAMDALEAQVRQLASEHRDQLLASQGGAGHIGDGSNPAVEALKGDLKTLEENNDALRASLRDKSEELRLALAEHDRTTQRVESLETSLRDNQAALDKATTAAKHLNSAKRQMASSHEEQILFLQMQVKSSKDAEARLQAAETEARTVKQAYDELQNTYQASLDKVAEGEANAGASAALVLEKEGLVATLRGEVSDLKVQLRKVGGGSGGLSEEEARQQAQDMARLREERDQVSQEIGSKDALVKRLRQEAEAAEQLHATRTALIATRDAQIAQLTVRIEALEGERSKQEEMLGAERRAVAEVQERHAAELAAVRQEVATLQDEAAKETEEAASLAATKLREHEDETNRLREDFSKKSTLARQLIAEKDDALQRLTQEAEELRSEVESGGHSERKIMELAQAQASREAEVKASVTVREQELLKLHEVLRVKEGQIQATTSELASLRNEVQQLRRMSRRDGVNMEYLKNIVVQYLALRDSSQKKTLERVLATLLQFSPDEHREIEDAQNSILPLWASPPPKEIRPPPTMMPRPQQLLPGPPSVVPTSPHRAGAAAGPAGPPPPPPLPGTVPFVSSPK